MNFTELRAAKKKGVAVDGDWSYYYFPKIEGYVEGISVVCSHCGACDDYIYLPTDEPDEVPQKGWEYVA
jgi:hypothetical protein